MPARIRLIRHEVVPKSGSYEVRFWDGREPKFFYWDDEPSRRLRPEQMTSAQALHEARTFAGRERDAIEDDPVT